MTYTDEDVKRLLGHMFNGGRWRRPEAPDEGMPTAKANPARLGTDMAEAIDMRRAWFAIMERGGLLDPGALYRALGDGLPVSTVAGERGVPTSTCEWRAFRDIAVLTDAINQGKRPDFFRGVKHEPIQRAALQGLHGGCPRREARRGGGPRPSDAGGASPQGPRGGRVKTSDLYLEDARCKFSDLPNAWCGCWSHRPDVSDDTPSRTNDNQGEA